MTDTPTWVIEELTSEDRDALLSGKSGPTCCQDLAGAGFGDDEEAARHVSESTTRKSAAAPKRTTKGAS
jgi:hypothetical protein